MPRRIATLALISVGCSSWPTPITVVEPTPSAIHSVDVLPFDLALWTEAGYDANPEQLRSTAAMNLANTTLAALASRSYGVAALIDWNGDYSGGTALEPGVLAAMVDSLAGFVVDPAQVTRPALPARLGVATGADATLYVGGWAYVANHHESVANKIAEGVTIGLLIVVAAVAAYEIAVALPHGLPLSGPGHHRGHAHSIAATPEHFATSGRSAAPVRGERVDLDIDVPIPDHPDWAHADGMPHDGDSMMFLEMTLIDNRTGLARWHAHQVFPANATSQRDVERAANALLASLPRSQSARRSASLR